MCIRDSLHAIHRRLQLFQIANVAPQAERVAAGLLDFQFRQIQFGLGAPQQADARARFRESQRQALTDASPGAGDQNAHVSNGVHKDQFSTLASNTPVTMAPPRFTCT